MSLSENIFKLRKQNGLSQESLAEEIGVTRQTISNWELGETAPNPEQLKSLSKVLNISIDDLLDNDIKNVIVDKVENTEKNTNVLSKIVKYIAIGFAILLIVDIISFIYFFVNKIGPFEEEIENNSSYVINNDRGDNI